MFHKQYTNIPKSPLEHPSTGGKHIMNGNSKREFGLALASFAIGAALVGLLGNSKIREKLLDGSKKLVKNLRSTD
jgi:hypothetical protein